MTRIGSLLGSGAIVVPTAAKRGLLVSMFLFRLGARIARHRGMVLAVWGLLLAGLIGGAGLLGTHYDDTFVIPGTQSQEGQDVLGRPVRDHRHQRPGHGQRDVRGRSPAARPPSR